MSDPPYWCFLLFTLFYFLLNKKKNIWEFYLVMGPPLFCLRKSYVNFALLGAHGTWTILIFLPRLGNRGKHNQKLIIIAHTNKWK
jgi:hypothetical protein